MAIVAIAPPRSTEISELIALVDGYVSEEHEVNNRITEYPIESGASLVDHVVRMPYKLRLEGRTSDLLLNGQRTGPVEDKSRASYAWDEILYIFEQRIPVVVYTSIRTYDNMLFHKCNAPVNVRTGRALHFTLELRELQYSQTEFSRFSPRKVTEDGPGADRTSEVNRGNLESTPLILAPT